ncbi:MAG: cell division protein ZapA [Alistipes sp.]|nr:cell division protein ZapA [Alistipes sp.]
MATRKHTFTILNKQYGLDIPDPLEEAYRIAERRLNEQLAEAMSEKWDGYNDRDFLAKVALDLATELVCLESENSAGVDSQALAALIEKIESRLK